MPDAFAWALFLVALLVAILGAKQLDDRDRQLFGNAGGRRRRRTTGTGRLGEDHPSTSSPLRRPDRPAVSARAGRSERPHGAEDERR